MLLAANIDRCEKLDADGEGSARIARMTLEDWTTASVPSADKLTIRQFEQAPLDGRRSVDLALRITISHIHYSVRDVTTATLGDDT